jgi:hypothetical protein
LDEALKDLEMGEGNMFLNLRSSMLDAEGRVRADIFKPRGDIHLNASGTTIASLRIRRMLEIMMPALNQAPVPVQAQAPAQVQTTPAPVQTPSAKPQRTRVQAPVQDQDPAPVVVNTTPVVNAPLVAEVVNAPVVVQHVAVVGHVETPMEVEDEDALLQRLFFKRFGRALPEDKEKEKEKEKESDVDQIKFVIDLTDDSDEMEVATSDVAPVAVVKTEPIEAAEAPVVNVVNVANVADAAKRRSFRLERLELAKARKAITEFGKSLRKSEIIPEKEAPLAADNVIATDDTDMAEDTSVGSVNAVESVNPESGKTYEQVMAEIDAVIEENTD